MGTQTHSSFSHLTSFTSCFLSKGTLGACPAACPALKLELSGDVTDRLKAAGLPKDQLGMRMSAG